MTPALARTTRFRRVAGLCALLVPLAGCGLSFQTLPKPSAGIGPHYTVKATFADVLNLPADAQVRIGPQVVGAVGSIGTRDFAAQVDLDIKDEVHLPVGTTAQVRFDNPLGDQYVLLTLPSSPSSRMLGAGEPLAQTDTSSAASVEDAFGALSTVLNGGAINSLGTIVHELNATFDGNQQQIHDLLGQINTAVSSLADGRVAVDNALTAIEGLSVKLNAGAGTITAGVDALAPAVGELASQNGEISDLLTNFAQLSDVANRIVDQSGTDSVRGIKALLPVLDQLVGVKQRLDQDLKDIAQFEALTPAKAPGDYLQVGLVLDVSLPADPSTPVAVSRTADPSSTSTGAVRTLLQGGLR